MWLPLSLLLLAGLSLQMPTTTTSSKSKLKLTATETAAARPSDDIAPAEGSAYSRDEEEEFSDKIKPWIKRAFFVHSYLFDKVSTDGMKKNLADFYTSRIRPVEGAINDLVHIVFDKKKTTPPVPHGSATVEKKATDESSEESAIEDTEEVGGEKLTGSRTEEAGKAVFEHI